MNIKTKGAFFAVLILLGIFFLVEFSPKKIADNGKFIADASYLCDGNKKIEASFYDGKIIKSETPDRPDTPGGKVDLVLVGGEKNILNQTISAGGGRYANKDESLVFWEKGNNVMILEKGVELNYKECVSVKSDPGGLLGEYKNNLYKFSLRYPTGYGVNEKYKYEEFGPQKSIGGVKFTIPESFAAGTNLARDTYLSIEQIKNSNECRAGIFLDDKSAKDLNISDNGMDYSFASSTSAGAGNRYEEAVYAIPGTDPCVAIRYFVHYGAIENYSGTEIKEFDKNQVLNEFDRIRSTFLVTK